MPIDSNQLFTVIEGADHPLGLQEIVRFAGQHPSQATVIKRVLRDMVRAGRLEREGKRFRVPAALGASERPAPARPERAAAVARPQIEGVVSVHPDGFGFVRRSDGKGEDIFLPPEEAQKALDHDRVLVTVETGRNGRSVGRVVRVAERTRQLVVGTYAEDARGAYVTPNDGALGPVRVPRTQLARPGDAVKVRLGLGKGLLDAREGLTGEVAGSLGRADDASVEVLSIAFGQGFHDEFPAEVMDEADAVPLEVDEAAARADRRRDVRTLPLVTIDGEDARDFDDAIFVEPKGSGFRLVVAIADVSHYVREGMALDGEARRRATSVYLPNRVLPMLPERLSNGICSLKPEEDRLCMVADMEIDKAGTTTKTDLYPAVMRSRARCTYNEVQRVLNGDSVPGRSELSPLFQRLDTLARIMTAMRLERGAIDFDLPETKVELDANGKPARMVRRERLQAHRIVEECMLAANEAVARYLRERLLPSVNRYHAPPDETKLETFAKVAAARGIFVDTAELSGKELNAVLLQLVGHPEQRALNQLLLRSMMQAVYSSKRGGHYGLGASDYLHFTSPIRRYPDLLVHRLLKLHWARKGPVPKAQKDREDEELERLAQQSSERERAAMQVEREVGNFYTALMMKDRVGEEYEGTVSGLTESGFFVELDGLLIDGMVKSDTVARFGELDPVTLRLRLGKWLVGVGQRVRVRVASVNLARRQVDLGLIEFLTEVEPLAVPPSGGKSDGNGRKGGFAKKGRSAGRAEAPAWKKGGATAKQGERTRPGHRDAPSKEKPFLASAPSSPARGPGQPRGRAQPQRAASEPSWKSRLTPAAGAPARREPPPRAPGAVASEGEASGSSGIDRLNKLRERFKDRVGAGQPRFGGGGKSKKPGGKRR